MPLVEKFPNHFINLSPQFSQSGAWTSNATINQSAHLQAPFILSQLTDMAFAPKKQFTSNWINRTIYWTFVHIPH